ncbi:ABC transporter ATP-binding protein [Mycoplasmoides pneumoniae]|uniref:Unspecified sugar ABC transport ATP-binding protein n=4 Tax=Mycoplasmoides pneumoniae TaxID=2104 RepID=A0AB38W837_MYCPM|nr:ABC transporter ATP-binding protein [Mycoplasmoides pneumoniae]ALA31093.1 sugar ABC transporter ATP-binding protein [Mycoplasmoides pneumoniae 19294]ALA31537.1 sugar ABC transporter ATP-binding protein [Mycoplasmoides pneumoniae 39443]ALA35769.1 sugar ABC transporter ATP-binding protein [Mycoplasmoides pneumoniae FH]ALA36477.1 sugar ABC transporter ATP-binding protein [Mycoplasmoides pneumoniae M1139]ALA37185.1 sugar ABC transporter ATP-binding protein [Mycoplasmoides pneumoniae]
MSKIAFRMENICKSFDNGRVKANVDVNLTVYENTVHTLLGENGAGKSTLTSILFGLYQPDSGKIFIGEEEVHFKSSKDAVQHKIGMVHQHFKLVDNYTVLDNIILGNESSFSIPFTNGKLKLPLLHRKASEAKIQAMMERYDLHVNLHQKVSRLTVGQQQRVEILKVLFRDSDILIFDEPTAVLSDQEIKSFLNIIKNFKKMGKTIVLISHKLNEIKEVAETATILRQGHSVGTFQIKDTSIDEMARLMMGKELKKTKNNTQFTAKGEPVLKVENLHLYLNQNWFYKLIARWNQKRINQLQKQGKPAKTLWLKSWLEGLAAIEKTPRFIRGIVNNLGFGSQQVFDKGISFEIHKGEIFAIAGVEGNGQNQLIDLICGLEKAAPKKVFFNGFDISRYSIRKRINAGIGFVLEDRHKYGLILDQTVRFNAVNNQIDRKQFSSWNFLNQMQIAVYTNQIVDKFDVRGAVQGTAIVRLLSGGNQQKLIIGRELTKQNELLVFAQVTRGLDVGAISFIHQKILDAKKQNNAILLVSYELDEILAIADTIGVINKGNLLEVNKRDVMTRERIGKLIMQ